MPYPLRKKVKNKTWRIARLVYIKLFRANDTPQRIAAGFGIGVFSGLFPGTGPLAALFLASVLRVNKASALAGSLITNTWLSVVTFLLSVKIGAKVIGVDWQYAYKSWLALIKNFSFHALAQLSSGTVFAVFLGYLLIALVCSLGAYIITLVAFSLVKGKRTKKSP